MAAGSGDPTTSEKPGSRPPSARDGRGRRRAVADPGLCRTRHSPRPQSGNHPRLPRGLAGPGRHIRGSNLPAGRRRRQEPWCRFASCRVGRMAGTRGQPPAAGPVSVDSVVDGRGSRVPSRCASSSRSCGPRQQSGVDSLCRACRASSGQRPEDGECARGRRAGTDWPTRRNASRLFVNPTTPEGGRRAVPAGRSTKLHLEAVLVGRG